MSDQWPSWNNHAVMQPTGLLIATTSKSVMLSIHPHIYIFRWQSKQIQSFLQWPIQVSITLCYMCRKPRSRISWARGPPDRGRSLWTPYHRDWSTTLSKTVGFFHNFGAYFNGCFGNYNSLGVDVFWAQCRAGQC